jgi:hypothetical protein
MFDSIFIPRLMFFGVLLIHFPAKHTVLCRNGQPQRMQPTSRRLLGVSASHQRGVLDTLFVDIFLFVMHGLIVDCARESHQGGVCQKGAAPSCRKPKDCGHTGGRRHNGCRSNSTNRGNWIRTIKGTVDCNRDPTVEPCVEQLRLRNEIPSGAA